MNPIKFKPSRKYVESLKVGDPALDPFGKIGRVESVFHVGTSLKDGRRFVCVTIEGGVLSSCTHSFKEGELVRSVHLTGLYTSAEADKLESELPEQDSLEVT
ncbi:MAG: hypothetical protein EBT82_03850 [Micrococcales bacterium]|nr:hypothetical protein [Micrococcales bacterium]